MRRPVNLRPRSYTHVAVNRTVVLGWTEHYQHLIRRYRTQGGVVMLAGGTWVRLVSITSNNAR